MNVYPFRQGMTDEADGSGGHFRRAIHRAIRWASGTVMGGDEGGRVSRRESSQWPALQGSMAIDRERASPFFGIYGTIFVFSIS
jgi:hypothetical protein